MLDRYWRLAIYLRRACQRTPLRLSLTGTSNNSLLLKMKSHICVRLGDRSLLFSDTQHYATTSAMGAERFRADTRVSGLVHLKRRDRRDAEKRTLRLRVLCVS